jgi:uncharacterized membrane protein YeaQ/YmgE (transglycosylase-associated protein family)
MAVLAEVVMQPGSIVAWLLVGLIAGWLAGSVMRGAGYGIVGDVIVGLIGSCIGGFICSFFVQGIAGFWGTVLVAFIGACVLIAIVRMFSSPGRRTI